MPSLVKELKLITKIDGEHNVKMSSDGSTAIVSIDSPFHIIFLKRQFDKTIWLNNDDMNLFWKERLIE
jgi:hypothetical protein